MDPGRANIASVVEVDVGTNRITRKLRLTAKGYYCDSGITAAKKKTEKWLLGIKAANEKEARAAAAEGSSREEYVKTVFDNVEDRWKVRASKKWKNLSFSLYSLKRKVLDRFVERVVRGGKDNDDYIIAYGGAKFASTGRKENYSSPAASVGTLLQRKAAATGRFAVVDEWNTSKVCHRCLEPLEKVVKEEKKKAAADGGVREVRGLRRCSAQRLNVGDAAKDDNGPQQSCPLAGAFIDRDYNAARNMVTKYMTGPSSSSYLVRGNRITSPKKNFTLHVSPHRCTTVDVCNGL